MRACDVVWFGNAVRILWQVGWALCKGVGDFFLIVFVALSRVPGGEILWRIGRDSAGVGSSQLRPKDPCAKSDTGVSN